MRRFKVLENNFAVEDYLSTILSSLQLTVNLHTLWKNKNLFNKTMITVYYEHRENNKQMERSLCIYVCSFYDTHLNNHGLRHLNANREFTYFNVEY